MSKKINVILIVLITFLIAVISGFGIKVSASVTSDNGNGLYEVKSNKTTAFNFTTHQTAQAVTALGGVSANQQVNVFVSKQTETSKVVTWAVQTGEGFKLSSVVNIAKDYESKHPGWKVVGGINADQYFTTQGNDITKGHDYFAPQPYYPMIADGEVWFGTTGYVNMSGATFVGIRKGGVEDSLFYVSANVNNGDSKVGGLFLSILDENGDVVEKFELAGLNQEPKDGEATLHMPYYTDSRKTIPAITVKGNLYIVEDAENCYVNNTVVYESYKAGNAKDAAFGRGLVSSIKEEASLNAGQFAINSKNEIISAALAVGKKVRVQYEFSSEMATVESAIGFHTVQRMDNADVPSNAAYNTKKYPRALIGRNRSGDIVLIAVDGNQAAKGMAGTAHDETNAILKHYGCVEAYQMDGGGSVTAILRNNNGGFNVVNSPSDGSARSVLSALLIVEKETPAANITIDAKAKEAQVNVIIDDANGYNFEKMYIKVGTKTFDVIDGVCTVTGLRSNYEYEYELRADVKGKEGIKLGEGTFKTSANLPVIKKCTLNDNTIKLDITDRDSTIKSIKIYVGDVEYDAINKEVVLDNLNGIIKLVITYDAGLGEVTMEVIHPESVFLQVCNKMTHERKSLND